MGSPRRLLMEGIIAVLMLAAAAAAAAASGPSSFHSMRYFYTALSDPGQGLPQYIIVGYVDDQPFVTYDSHTRKMLPLVPWMEKVTKDDPQYWERNTQIAQASEAVNRVDLETLRDRFHQQNSTGLHTVQRMSGCEAGPEGQFRGGDWQYAYDGEDFLALDLETLTWTARVPQARQTKTRWETETHNAQRQKAYLEEICVEWLRRHLANGEETLQRTEAPTVRVARKKGFDGLETLICRLHGFYPKEIEVTWTKDGEDKRPETSSGGVVPNSDGTYHTWLSIEVDTKERDRYRCHVEHDGLPETLDVAWEDPGPNLGLILGIVGGVFLAALLLVGAAGVALCMRRQKKKKGYAAPSGSDQGSDASTRSATGPSPRDEDPEAKEDLLTVCSARS